MAICNTLDTHADIGDSSELNGRLRVYGNDLDLPADVDFALQHFSYNNSGVLNLVYGHLNRTNFTGITVRACVHDGSIQYYNVIATCMYVDF